MNRPLAIIPVRNEADILPWVVKHLVEQGCDIHLIDNWSSDWSSVKLPWDIQYDQRLSSEMWPSKGPDSYWQWTEMLQRIEEIAQAHDGWVLFNDADEIRRSPRTGETIADGLARVALRGYNAIAFRLYEFWPTDNSYTGNPESHFTHYRDDSLDTRLPHIKAWLSKGQRVDLHTHGGHQAMFMGRSIELEQWILKHYPIRTQEQGTRKLADRRQRYSQSELSLNWHAQYTGLNPQAVIKNPSELCRYSNAD